MKYQQPTWAEQAMFYHIYPLGLLGAPILNSFILPEHRLSELHGWITHIKEMGLNALYVGPIFESTQHGYDTVDYYNVDRRLGSNHDFKLFSQILHDAGIKLVLDAVFHHVGRDFWAFKDVQKNGKQSMFVDWFSGIDFSRKSNYGDNFAYDGWNGYFNLVKLNLKNADVRDHLFAAVSFCMNEFAIDGLRLDVAESMDLDFLAELSVFCKNRNDDFWLMGEMIHGNYNKLTGPARLDSVTNYELYKGLYSAHNDHNYFEIAHSLNRQFGDSGIYKDLHLYNFADNHDVTRVASILKNVNHLFPLYLLLFTIPGIPSIYYGSEWAAKGVRTAIDDSMLRPQLDLIADDKAPDIYGFICKLIGVRKQCQALWKGTYRQIYVQHEAFVFCREFGGELVIIAINASKTKANLLIPVQEVNHYIDLLDESFRVQSDLSNQISVSIPAYNGRLMVGNGKKL